MKGHLILIVGPSGSGKGSLIQHVRLNFKDLYIATSLTTRAPRPGETDGDVYRFVDESEFKEHIEKGSLLEWAEYGGHLYGTLKSEILEPMQRGSVVLREVDVQGARAIRKMLPKENLTSVFLNGGAWEIMARRIRERAPITEDELARREERFKIEQKFEEEADFVVQNLEGQIEQAKRQMHDIVQDVISKQGKNKS